MSAFVIGGDYIGNTKEAFIRFEGYQEKFKTIYSKRSIRCVGEQYC